MTLCHGWSPTCGSSFKTSAHCCRVFLIVKIHTALDQDKLILTKLLFFTAMLKAVRVFQWFVSPEVLLYVHAVKPCVRGACQTTICTPRWTVILHKYVNFSLIWNVLCALSKHMKARNVNHYIVSRQKSIKQFRLAEPKEHLPLSNAIFTSSTESLNPDIL